MSKIEQEEKAFWIQHYKKEVKCYSQEIKKIARIILETSCKDESFDALLKWIEYRIQKRNQALSSLKHHQMR